MDKGKASLEGLRQYAIEASIGKVYGSEILDYLVDETGMAAEVTDKEMLDRITEIDHLDQQDKKTIIHVIDSLLRDAKAKKAYAAHT